MTTYNPWLILFAGLAAFLIATTLMLACNGLVAARAWNDRRRDGAL